MKTMRYTMILLIALLSMNVNAQNETKKSPAVTVKKKLAGINLEITYGQPSKKGRDIYGGLVPFGEVWRAGANEATTFSVDRGVEINGQPLPEGKYALFILPKKEEQWEVIFNKENQQWGAYNYDKKQDALRVKVSPIENDLTEKLTYTITDDGWVKIAWDTTRIEFKVE